MKKTGLLDELDVVEGVLCGIYRLFWFSVTRALFTTPRGGTRPQPHSGQGVKECRRDLAKGHRSCSPACSYSDASEHAGYHVFCINMSL